MSEAAATDAAEVPSRTRGPGGGGRDGLPEQFASHGGRAYCILRFVGGLHRRRDAEAQADAADAAAAEYLVQFTPVCSR